MFDDELERVFRDICGGIDVSGDDVSVVCNCLMNNLVQISLFLFECCIF